MDDFWDDISDIIPSSTFQQLNSMDLDLDAELIMDDSPLKKRTETTFDDLPNPKIPKYNPISQESQEIAFAGDIDDNEFGLSDAFNDLIDDPIESSEAESDRRPGSSEDFAGRVSTDSVGKKFKNVFPFAHFNKVQSQCFDLLFNSSENVVVTAPTGAGKTGVMELAICEMIKSNDIQTSLVVYLAPLKALCHERYLDWKQKFDPLHLKCKELTGDTKSSFSIQINFVVTTPEKWDSYTRKNSNIENVMKKLKLVLIDEIQHIAEDRGATLEAVLCRMKVNENHEVRYIAVSATCPNAYDIGEFLKCKASNVLCFGEEYRPVTLSKFVRGYPQGKNMFLFQQNLKYKVFDVIHQYYDKRPSLVFCGTRKDTISSVQQILKDGISHPSIFLPHPSRSSELRAASGTLSDKMLKEIVPRGVAYYHAGLSVSDRNIVQKLFGSGCLMVVCATSSLAKGVNLPAHLVVIQGTQMYNAGIYEEFSIIDVLQMIGRAGRPQFDKSGTAVIMTSDEKVNRYSHLISGQEMVESTFLTKIPTFLNTEIAIGTIRSARQAHLWLFSTFLYRRIISNPSHYNIPSGLTISKLDNLLKEMLLSALQDLKSANMVKIQNDGFLVPLPSGICMSNYSIAFGTMKLFQELDHENVSMSETILVFARAKEFSQITLRRCEKNTLNQLHHQVKYRREVEGKRSVKVQLIRTSEEKIMVLIQSILGDLDINEWSLKQEAIQIISSLLRITKGAISFFQTKSRKSAIENILLFSQSIHQKLWFDSQEVCRQIPKIGKKMCATLAEQGIHSFEELEGSDPRMIEEILKRNFPFGTQIHDSLSKMWPKVSILCKQEGKQLSIRVIAEHPIPRNGKPSADSNYSTLLVNEEGSDEILFINGNVPNFTERYYEVSVPISTRPILCQVFNNEFVGMNAIFIAQPMNSSSFEQNMIVDLEIEEKNPLEENQVILPNKEIIRPSFLPPQNNDVKANFFKEKLSKYSHVSKKQNVKERKANLPGDVPQGTLLFSDAPRNTLTKEISLSDCKQRVKDLDLMGTLQKQQEMILQERELRIRIEQRVGLLEKQVRMLLQGYEEKKRGPCQPQIFQPSRVIPSSPPPSTWAPQKNVCFVKEDDEEEGEESTVTRESQVPLHPVGREISKWYSLAKQHSTPKKERNQPNFF